MAKDLVTLEEYKSYVGITNPNQDGVISAIIPKVSALVKSICRRSFVDYVEDFKVETFSGGDYLNPAEVPVLSISSLEVSTDYGQNYTELVEYTDWVFDQEDQVIKPIDRFDKLINGYRVTYTAGFPVLPEDLKLAVFDLVTYYIKNDAAVHSSKAPGTNTVQIEYISTTNLPSHIKRVLDLYMMNYN